MERSHNLSLSVISILWPVTCELTLPQRRTHIYFWHLFFYIRVTRTWPLLFSNALFHAQVSTWLTYLRTLCATRSHVTLRFALTRDATRKEVEARQAITHGTLADELNERSTCMSPPHSLFLVTTSFFVLTLKLMSRATASKYYKDKIKTACNNNQLFAFFFFLHLKKCSISGHGKNEQKGETLQVFTRLRTEQDSQ